MANKLNRPLRVLYIDNSFTFGGAINALSDLLRAIDRSRVEPVVLSAQDEAFLATSFDGVEVHHWPVELPWVNQRYHSRVQRLPGLRRGPLRFVWNKARAAWWLLFRDLPELRRVARFARLHRIDLVHLNNGVNGMVPALLAAKLLRLPVVAHGRGPTATTGFRRRYARLADRWISVSGSVTDNLAEAGVSRGNVELVHDAIDLSVFSESNAPAGLRDELGVGPDAAVFGVFARIIPWKGIREFVQAAGLVIAEVPEAVALVVGDRSDGDEEYYRDVVSLAERLGIRQQIRFTGFRRDVADLMRACDVVVHTSIVPEPFGLTVIEGMATGRPVIAANAGGPTEIIEPGETGYLVDPADSRALADAIIRLLRDSDTARAVGRRAAERARTHYSAARYARDIEQVYEYVLGNGRRGDAS